jgi:hypothetical protein
MTEAVRIVPLFIRWLDFDAARRVRESGAIDPGVWRVVSEDCLAPYLCDGDAVMVAFDRQPRDGDLVLVEMRYRRAGMIGEGSIRTRESLKQLRIVGGERFLCATDGGVSADPHEILGTIVAWHRRRWWRRPSPTRMRFEPRLAGPAPSAA